MLIYLLKYYIFKLAKGDLPSLLIVENMFRHIQFNWSRLYASSILKNCISKYGTKSVSAFFSSACIIEKNELLNLKRSVINANKPFHKRLIILSPPKKGMRGVLLLKYTYYFFYLSQVFDLDKLLDKYILVLEPSFSAYFNPSILYLIGRPEPIIIQASETVDYEFIENLDMNLIPIDIGANCWVDSNTFFPMSNVAKNYDIIMVSLWADFKRHYHLFEILSKCKNKDKIRVALVGLPWPKTLQDIKRIAEYYGINHCIEFFEKLSQEKVNILLNESKVYLLLSKKEGFNKSIIEAMYANTPGFLLEGFNYGQHYSYINKQTGGFIHPSKLVEFIENIDSILQTNNFSPNKWILKHMCVENSMAKLFALLSKIEKEMNIEINKEMAIKINTPDCDYRDPSYWVTYSDYYKDLKEYLHKPISRVL